MHVSPVGKLLSKLAAALFLERWPSLFLFFLFLCERITNPPVPQRCRDLTKQTAELGAALPPRGTPGTPEINLRLATSEGSVDLRQQPL